MPSGMSFVQLEGNYVISFRDTKDALPAYTAVKLDRDRRGSWDGVMLTGSGTNLSALGAGGGHSAAPRRGSVGVGVTASGGLSALSASLGLSGSPAASGSLAGSRTTLTAEELQARRKSSVAAAVYKLVLTGVPRGVREDALRSRLDLVIPGIERVYRDPDMRHVTHPPVFVETRSALAESAFMLRADWVPVVQRLVREADAPAASEDEGLGMSLTASSALDARRTDAEDGDDAERRRRQDLVSALVTCPHGRYGGQANCPVCRSAARRNTMLADDIVGHNNSLLGAAEGGVAAIAFPGARTRPAATDAAAANASAPPAPAVKKGVSCPSCMACLLRLVPARWRTPESEDDEETFTSVEVVAGAPQRCYDSPVRDVSLLDPSVLTAIKNQRRKSAYDDVPVINVSDADS